LSGCVFCANFFLYLVLNYVPGWLREQGHSLQYSVGAVSAFNAGGILGSLLIAWLVDRNGWRKTLPPVFVAAAVCLALLEPSRSFDGMLLPVIVLCGFLGYGGAVNFGPLILSVFPAPLRTQAVGCALGLGRLGGAIGPLLASLALSAGAPVGRLFYGAALAALLIVLNLTLLPSRQRTALSVAQ
jgi:AAHS family 4-hydroxybenzoate transporter-like MFS transporter